MRRFVLPVVLIAGAVVLSSAASAKPVTYISFQTPSKNIACGYAAGLGGPPSLRCDIRTGLKPEPRRRCQLDWTGLSMNLTGIAGPACAGDTVVNPNAKIVAYGSIWSRGGFTCLSARIGLMCTNRTGNGFFLSKERWQVG